MKFDLATRKASAQRTVFMESDMGLYPAWSFFLPDAKALIFAIGSAADFSGMGVGIAGGMIGADIPKSDLYFVDLASGTSKMLAKAMGFASEQDIASDKTYLPFGAAEELHHHYYPTVAPVPAGGYFWVFFDSWRHYGNQGSNVSSGAQRSTSQLTVRTLRTPVTRRSILRGRSPRPAITAHSLRSIHA
jgi:hypothetical protein